MIELRNEQLIVRFPEVHSEADLRIDFQRTLRIPDDGRQYPLPAGFGRFPLRHVDDFADRVPERWLEHGGVMMPMYQSEALWLHFSGRYPFALKVATGKIDAVTGKEWANGLHRRPQDYLVTPPQPWLDGYCVEKGVIRQFVAMPLGSGYSVEEQITGAAEHGGIQIIAYPMRREAYEERFGGTEWEAEGAAFGMPMVAMSRYKSSTFDMGLAPGGRMKQEIYRDRYDFDDWDQDHASRCFVHIANSLAWRAITGQEPPTPPLTAREYREHHIPWFDYYAEHAEGVQGSSILEKLKSVVQVGKEKDDVPLPDNESVDVEQVVELRSGLKEGQVREGVF